MGLVVATVPGRQEREGERERLMQAVGRLWAAGVEIGWESMYEGQVWRKLPLPTYPFERLSYWIEAQKTEQPIKEISRQSGGKLPLEQWFTVPVWKQSLHQHNSSYDQLMQKREEWIIFADTYGIGNSLADRLLELGQKVAIVTASTHYSHSTENTYTLRPLYQEDYSKLFQQLRPDQQSTLHILHLWNITDEPGVAENPELDRRVYTQGFYSLLFLVQAIGRLNSSAAPHLLVYLNNAQAILGDDLLYPEKALILGLGKTLPQEYPQLYYRCIDFSLTPSINHKRLIQQALYEACLPASSDQQMVAYRGIHRWVETFEPLALSEQQPLTLKNQGVYLITGGLGGLGLNVAQYITQTVQHPRLALLGRSSLPEREHWNDWLMSHSSDEDQTRAKILRIRQLEQDGAEVLLLQADIADRASLETAIHHLHRSYGGVTGVFHLAGVPGHGLSQTKSIEQVEAVFAAKVHGTIALQQVLANDPLDFSIFFSSSTAVLGGLGEGEYAAANAFLDAWSHYFFTHHGQRTLSINWGPWTWDAWQKNFFTSAPDLFERISHLRKRYGITFQEGQTIFPWLLSAGVPQVIVLPQGWQEALQQVQELSISHLFENIPVVGKQQDRKNYPRPVLRNPYVAPITEVEQKIAVIWQQHLGIDTIGINDHFFELGGSSLLGMQIVSHMQKEFNTNLATAILFEYPTIALLAAVIAASSTHLQEDISQGDERGRLRKARIRRNKQNITL